MIKITKEIFIKRYKWIRSLIASIGKDNISAYSAQCSYYTILSFIPFVILLITLIQYTPLEPQVLFNIFSKMIPENMNGIVLSIIEEVYSKSIGTISISLIFTLWSAGKGLFVLTKGLRKIYTTDEKEKSSYIYLRAKSIIQTILFIFLITIGLVLLVFGDSIISTIRMHFEFLENFGILLGILKGIAYIIATFITFLLLYKFIPRHKQKLKSQFMGALFGSIALNIVSFIFSKYLYIFKGFSLTYGSLTTLMLIMMWTYACFYILFLGAEINKKLN